MTLLVSDPKLSAADTAIYIEKMCVELRNIAATSDLNLLAYLLDVAREEAAQQSGATHRPTAVAGVS